MVHRDTLREKGFVNDILARLKHVILDRCTLDKRKIDSVCRGLKVEIGRLALGLPTGIINESLETEVEEVAA